MKLTDLNPRWFAEEGRHGQGVVFDCPHCIDKPNGYRLAVAFAPALDGGTPFPIKKIGLLFEALKDSNGEWSGATVPPGVVWQRTGDTFETLSMHPSVNAEASGHWHGWLQNGEVR